MKISQQGIDLIKKWEGFRSSPYLDAAKVPTIGYGTTFYPNGKKVTMRDKSITEQEAEAYLRAVIAQFERVVNRLVTSKINQNQFDALVSFVYNVGSGNFQKSTLLKLVNENPNHPDIGNWFLKYNKASGRELKGLTNRRNDEATLYGVKKKPLP
ncbi:lysozyme [Capnocytophaga canimorsus]|uniref:lysozyme n=1 Tax=Capnocytophaga canimorsus TaxID=28188 RepID=UPI0037D980CD